ncbi:MAG: class A beta-lactamase [Acidobacteriota bacterium]|nr:class A beta-lactamase [Acidobacteriota bacterium]
MPRPLIALLCLPILSFAQPALQQKIAAIAAEAQGKVSVACSLPGTKLNCDLNPRAHPPMQSVFKAPLAVTALHLVEQGKLQLDRAIHFRASDRILPHAWSPLQKQYPNAEVDVPLRELLHLAVSQSDNVAADIALRTIGGAAVAQAYMASLGVAGFHLQDDEAAMHADHTLQYRNWFEPAAAAAFLRLLADRSPLTPADTDLMFGWMGKDSRIATRIAGQLPEGTVVMHKSGSLDTENGVTNAWNDIGLIVLPDGRKLAIAIFITDSRLASDEARDGVAARIARAAYDAALGMKP